MKLWVRFKSFLKESKRVFQITRKPTMSEFKTIFKATGLGIVIIGLIGFVINIIAQVTPRLL